jgi:Skp family chaperone for outer membrane proteins
MRKRIRILFLLIAAAAMMITAGCSTKPAADTKAPAQSDVGIITMNKVIRSHPKYAELERLRGEMSTLTAQIEQQAGNAAGGMTPNAAAGTALAGLDEALQQEYTALMTAKQAEMQQRLDAKAAQFRKELSAQMQAFAGEMDTTYQPQIFSLQLKLKTVQMTKEEADKLQQELEALQAERSSKLAAKERELAGQLEARMKPEQQAAEQELAAYAEEVHAKNKEKFAAKSAELTARNSQAPALAATSSDLQQRAGMKRQEIAVLEEFISKDIKDKTAKIAEERKLSVVLTNVRVNSSAVDISDSVIAEFKK